MRLLLSAGEPSGERHAALLLASLRRRVPDIEALAFGGPLLAREGARVLFPLSQTAVMGVGGVWRHLGTFVSALRAFDDALSRHRPDAVVLVDYPGLHLRFARLARRRGVPVVDYVCPQLWAWAPWRAPRFARAVDLALAILPFEERYFADIGVETRYVGHPSADRPVEQPSAEEAAVLDAESQRPLVLLLPGSRRAEIEANLPVEIEVARRLSESLTPAPRFALVQEHDELVEACRGLLARAGLNDVAVLRRLSPALARARAALSVSGTVTLEVARHGVPLVVLYRAPPLSLALGRRLLSVPWISLVNLVAGEELAPEFVFSEPPVTELAAALRPLIEDGERRRRVVAGLRSRLAPLFRPGTAQRAAEAVLALLEHGSLR